MATRNYPRLPIEQFGQHLLDSGDLDPVYVALYQAEWPEAQRNRFLVAYWCLYHVGLSCWLSEREGRDFWMALREAAENVTECPVGGRWPRGSERRHWRGENARKSVRDLMGKYLHEPEAMVDRIASASLSSAETSWGTEALDMLPYQLVEKRVKEHSAFGPWIAFKVADMIDRLGIAQVSFDNGAVFMFDDPRKSALMLARRRMGLPEDAKFKDETATINHVVSYLESVFKHVQAPPLFDRPVGLQEVETILCKWKSHMNGHYPLNHDLIEIAAGALPWVNHSKAAHSFLEHLPRLPGQLPGLA